MLQGIDLSQRIDFVSAEDIVEPKTVFVFKPLSGVDVLSLAKFMTNNELSNEYVIAMMGKSIVEIKNPDINKKEKIIEFIVSLKPSVLMELINESTRVNQLTRQEEKN